MKDQFSTSNQPTLPGFDSAISSLESEDGLTPCASPDGQMTGQYGPEARPASRSASPGSTSGETTPAILRPTSSISSPPADLLSSLESKSPARQSSERLQAALEGALRRNLSGRGSTMYRLTWKPHTTPSGRAISRLRASGHRISANGAFSAPTIFDLPQVGWPTADARAMNLGDTTWQERREKIKAQKKNGNGFGMTLAMAATLAGHNTPRATDGSNGGPRQSGGALPADVALSTWPTATTRDCKDGSYTPNVPTNALLGREVWSTDNPSPARLAASGEMLTGSSARMESGGQLNPAFSLWLMGFPAAWVSCGARAMQSCRSSRRNSSRPSSGREK